MSPSKNLLTANRLLLALPKQDLLDLLPHLKEVPLVFGEVLYDPHEIMKDAYFPNSGIISLVAGAKEHDSLEVGMVGNEGMVGLNVFLGNKSSMNLAVVQGSGTAMRIKSSALVRVTRNGSALSRILQRYAHTVITHTSRYAVCNQFHSIDARLARWLLMTHDRMGGDEFQVTQNFLSHMLGVRREGVSIAAAELRKRSLISYSRGSLTILNRRGLEATSCDCYEVLKSNGGL